MELVFIVVKSKCANSIRIGPPRETMELGGVIHASTVSIRVGQSRETMELVLVVQMCIIPRCDEPSRTSVGLARVVSK